MTFHGLARLGVAGVLPATEEKGSFDTDTIFVVIKK